MLEKIILRLKLIFLPCQNNKYRPEFLTGKFLLYYAVFLLLLKLVIIPVFFYFPQTVFFADITKTNLIEFANSARGHFSLQPLKESQTLNQAAYLKGRDMIDKGYFAHYSPAGTSPWYWLKISGYDYSLAGENLAIGFLDSEQVHVAWMNSFSHQKNILNPSYREIGIAVLTDNFQGNKTTLVVQYFGAKKAVFLEQELLPAQVAAAQEKPEIEIAEEKRPAATKEIKKIEENEPALERALLSETEQMIAPAVVKEPEKSPTFLLFQFMTSDYYNFVQKIIYGSLILIIISLLATVYCDIFVYRRFEIQYKDIIFKAAGYSALWLILIFLDKLLIVQIIGQNFRIN